VLFARKIMLSGAAWAELAAVAAFVPVPRPEAVTLRVPIPDLVELRSGAFAYRASGDFTRDGRPARPPLVIATIPRKFAVMRHQVTETDYRRCVDAGVCPAMDHAAPAFDRPVVKVSWRDAQIYASWLSGATGIHFRLPTDEEWAHAAASRFADDGLPEAAYGSDPGRRALTLYDAGVGRNTDREPQPVGTFGTNENGLVDVAGNVWEWTDTCFVRGMLDRRGAAATIIVNCGVRVVEGRHRAYLPDFVRDPRNGGCSFGMLPSNLGFRLVRDDDWWWEIRRLL
jgi:formylglycine-generating enzyme required for sulfatase activity